MLVLSEPKREVILSDTISPVVPSPDSQHEDEPHFLPLPRGRLHGLRPLLTDLPGEHGDQHGGEDGEDGG